MRLLARLERLERSHPPPEPILDFSGIEWPPGLEERVLAAVEAGTFPKSLSLPDLEALVGIGDEAERRGRAGA